MSRYVEEPQSEYLRIMCPFTKGILYCVNRNSHLRQPGWKSRFLIHQNVPIIDVTKVKPIRNTKSFTHDAYVDRNKTQEFVELLVDYSCLIHDYLKRYGSVVVHCKNGRSRSPTCILAYLMLQGLSKDHAVAWLTEAFTIQRPTIAERSAEFPNFAKFDNVILRLEDALEKTSLTARVQQNVKYLASSSSSSSSSSSLSSSSSSSPSKSSFGLPVKPFAGPFIVPKRWKGILPVSSFCRSTDKYETLVTDGNSNGRVSTRRKKRIKAVPPSISRNISGRRVKVLVSTDIYKVGTLITKSGEFWMIAMDDGTKKRTKKFDNAFLPGTRCLVDWEQMGEKFDGVVTEWNGGLKYKVWFDLDGRSYLTTGAELYPSSKKLSKNTSKRIQLLVDSLKSKVTVTKNQSMAPTPNTSIKKSQKKRNASSKKNKDEHENEIQQLKKLRTYLKGFGVVLPSPGSSKKTKLQSKIFSSKLITGARVRVFWDEDNEWFYGHCGEKIGQYYFVHYDDGDVKLEPVLDLVVCSTEEGKASWKASLIKLKSGTKCWYYTSPQGNKYDSMKEVCQHLKKIKRFEKFHRKKNGRGNFILPSDWTHVTRIGQGARPRRYKSYISPNNKKFTSLVAIERYLTGTNHVKEWTTSPLVLQESSEHEQESDSSSSSSSRESEESSSSDDVKSNKNSSSDDV